MPPVIGIVAAVGSVAAGASALAAGSLLVGGAMIAGGVMTGLGVLTGSAKLQKYGGLLSLAGGIGGLATNAWEKAAEGVAKEASTQTLGQTENLTPVVDGAGSSAATEAAASSNVPAAAAPDVGYMGPGSSGAGAGTDALLTEGAGPAALQNPLRVQEAAAGVANPGAAPAGNGLVNAARKGWDYITDPKNAKTVEIGSGIVSGALKYAFPSALDKAQIARLQYEQMQRDRLNASVTGVANPVPFQANPNAQIFNQTPVDATNRFVPMPGLVNQARGG